MNKKDFMKLSRDERMKVINYFVNPDKETYLVKIPLMDVELSASLSLSEFEHEAEFETERMKGSLWAKEGSPYLFPTVVIEHFNELLEKKSDLVEERFFLGFEYYSWETIEHYMDNEIREYLHRRIGDKGKEEFLKAYLDLHYDRFGEDFVIN